MNAASHPRSLLLLWSCVLVPPVAWAVALGLLFVLADDACGGSRAWLVVSGIVLLLTAAGAGLVAHRTHGRTQQTEGDDGDYGRFMLELAIGLAALFALVNLVSTVPIFLLSACPQ
jgi:hypothetical protein